MGAPWTPVMVGRTGLEPVTPCVSCKCATRLRQRPLEGSILALLAYKRSLAILGESSQFPTTATEVSERMPLVSLESVSC
jgi:hypothetical protein